MGVDLIFDGARLSPQLAIEALFDPGLAGAESGHPHHRVLVDLGLAAMPT